MQVNKGQYNKTYGVLIMRALDILLCTWIWRNYDITVSSMCGLELRRHSPRWWAVVLGRWVLNNIEADHCELAIAADLQRAREAEAILNP